LQHDSIFIEKQVFSVLFLCDVAERYNCLFAKRETAVSRIEGEVDRLSYHAVCDTYAD